MQAPNSKPFQALSADKTLSNREISSLSRATLQVQDAEVSLVYPHRERGGDFTSPSSSQAQLNYLTQRFVSPTRVGEGSFGQVWRARDTHLARDVAIKSFKGDQETALQACREELRFVGQLDHPSIPTIYDARLNESESPIIVMKLLNGQSLKEIIDLLKSGDPKIHQDYPFVRRVEIIIQLLKVTRAAHRKGILHRDIKPENVLLGRDGEFSLIDWGCAVTISEVQERSQICGTPAFMAPEQAFGLKLSEASDLFAICGVAYELLTLTTPTPDAPNIQEFMKMIATFEPHRLDQVHHPAQGYPPSEFAEMIMQGLSRQPADRPQKTDDLIEFLEGALAGDICVVCPRTYIKSRYVRLERFLNKNPFVGVPVFVLSLITFFAFLIGLGIWIGTHMALPS